MHFFAMNRCRVNDIPVYGTFAVVLAGAAVATDYTQVSLWCLVVLLLISCLWPESRSMPYVITMFAPAVFGDSPATQMIVVLGAYGFYLLSLEFELLRPAQVPCVVQQEMTTPNPVHE